MWRPIYNVNRGKRPWFVARQEGKKWVYYKNNSIDPARYESRDEALVIADKLNNWTRSSMVEH